MRRSADYYGAGSLARVLALLAAGTLLVSCVNEGSEPQAEAPGPVAAIAQAKPVKVLAFQWSGGDGATSFRVSRVDGDVPAAVVQDIPASATSYDLEVFLPAQLGAEYVVEACNSAGCTPSAPVGVERSSLDVAIGYVKAHAPGEGDFFGRAVALSGDGRVLAVGAQVEDGSGAGVHPPVDDALADSGAVYVYTGAGAGEWEGPVYLKAPVPGMSDGFGTAVALSADGRLLAVGAAGESGSGSGVNPPHDDGQADSGAVYLFEMSETGVWGDPTYLKADPSGPGDAFGYSVALSADGKVLAVGAPLEAGGGSGVDPPADDSMPLAGAVWVYELSAAGVWIQAAYVKASDPTPSDGFGYSVALSGDGRVLAVGAPFEDGSGAGVGPSVDDDLEDAGAVWVYVKDESGEWVLEEYLKAASPGSGDGFGFSVALDAEGSLLAVGAVAEDGSGTGFDPAPDEAGTDTGAVYLFERDAGGAWSEPAYLKPGSPSTGASFGSDVKLSADGEVLVVGAGADSGAGTGVHPPTGAGPARSGAAWVFHRSAGWSDGVRLKAPNPGGDDFFGLYLALSADGTVLAVGAIAESGGAAGIGGNLNDNSLPSAGAVYLY